MAGFAATARAVGTAFTIGAAALGLSATKADAQTAGQPTTETHVICTLQSTPTEDVTTCVGASVTTVRKVPRKSFMNTELLPLPPIAQPQAVRPQGPCGCDGQQPKTYGNGG